MECKCTFLSCQCNQEENFNNLIIRQFAQIFFFVKDVLFMLLYVFSSLYYFKLTALKSYLWYTFLQFDTEQSAKHKKTTFLHQYFQRFSCFNMSVGIPVYFIDWNFNPLQYIYIWLTMIKEGITRITRYKQNSRYIIPN